MEGWVKIKNNIHDDPILNKDSEYLSVWIYLLTKSAFSEYDVIFSGEVTTLQKGQMVTSLSEIAKKTGVNISKVNRILKRLKIEKQIEMETDMQKTLITLDFSDYYEMKGEKGTEKGVKNDRKTTQETENEKEKSSKREKVKEKEIKKNIKNVKNKTPLYPPGDDEEELFNLFWQSYPKRIGRIYAKRCFDKINPSKELVDAMLEAIKAQRKSEMWQRDKGQYIPNPSTWLNQRRWEDNLSVDIIDQEEEDFWAGIEIRV